MAQINLNGQAIELNSSQPHSVEISCNAKGEVAFSVKVYSDVPENAAAESIAVYNMIADQINSLRDAVAKEGR